MTHEPSEGSSERWSAPDRWQVLLAALSLLVAVVAVVEQVVR
ncbi:hypothetical protein [Streptomyces sp. AJS327]|nr:hypothetical protein [Streptomyces sp. AJS327]